MTDLWKRWVGMMGGTSYEAYVLYTFLSLLVGFLGGEATLLCVLEGKQPVRLPIPFCCFRFRPGRYHQFLMGHPCFHF